MSRQAAVLRWLVAGWLLAVADSQAAAEPGFEYYVSGNADDVERETRGLIVLQGGGDDVDANYEQMGRYGGGGDFVVLRASGKDEYNDYIYARCGCDSVETIVFTSADAATDPFVVETIRDAEALFIAGGDQSRYVSFWKDTPVQDAIHFVAARPAPVAGTSAGMAILGEFAYSAMGETSVLSGAALSDPYLADLTLERDFLHLPALSGILTDQHLKERDRLGRTLVFLARLIQDGWSESGRAIAADRETALHIDPASGIGTVFATPDHETPFVWVLSATKPPTHCRPGEPLTFRDIAVTRLGPGDRFDVVAWHTADGLHYTLDVDEGVIESSRSEIY